MPTAGKVTKNSKDDNISGISRDLCLLEKIDDDVMLINKRKKEMNQEIRQDDKHLEVKINPSNVGTSTNLDPEGSKISKDLNHKPMDSTGTITNPENDIDEEEGWDDPSKYYKNTDPKSFRQYELACDRVKQFYEEQHEKQTVAFNIQARINFKTKTRARMTVWEGLEKLNKLLDESDPDTELSQIDHALQTAEAIRRDKRPRWFQLV